MCLEEMADSNLCNSNCDKCVEKSTFLSIPKLLDINVCLSRLTELDLSSCSICKIPESVGNLVNIIKLDLSSNELDTLPLSFIKLHHTTEIILSYNKFVRVPQCLIDGMCSIAILDLSHNQLIDISSKLFCFQRLQTLNISNNLMLNSFPQWLWSIECSLESLDVSFTNCLNNNVEDPYQNMYGISKNLKYLNISNTYTNVLKLDFIKHLKNLCTLVVDNEESKEYYNYFNCIPLVFNYRYKSVTTLSMSNVDLSSIGKHLYFSLPKLRFLNLSNNAIVLLPDSFGNMINLEVCDLSNNQILAVPECFKNLKNLKELILNNNWLPEFPRILDDLINLEVLDLYANKLNVVPFWNLDSKIKSLDLEQNIFSTESNIDQNIKANYLKLLKNLRLSIKEDRIIGPLYIDELNDDLESSNESDQSSSQWSSRTSTAEDNIDEEKQEDTNFLSDESWECDSYEYTTALFDPKEFELCFKNELMKLEKPPTFNEKNNEKRSFKNVVCLANEHYFCPSDELPAKMLPMKNQIA